jgi:hypothetical protein
MLLTILLGAVAARLMFPHFSNWEAGILATVLAPTDAGLGQIVVNSPRVPVPIRQALAQTTLGLSFKVSSAAAVSFLFFNGTLTPATPRIRRLRISSEMGRWKKWLPLARPLNPAAPRLALSNCLIPLVGLRRGLAS